MIEVLEPQDSLLQQFVDSIYILKRDTAGFEVTAYPTVNTPVALFRNVAMSLDQGCVYVDNSDTPNHFAMGCNQFSSVTRLQYVHMIDEIAINFKALGFASFTRSKPAKEKVFPFHGWDTLLPGLFSDVFATDDKAQQLHGIESILLSQYKPVNDETILLKALDLLNDITTDYKMEEIAGLLGIHYKQLYRIFIEYIGCTMAHYRKLVKFRSSVVSKIETPGKPRLVDICYDNDYTDQAYFTKQFKGLTGEKPTRFFKEVTSFGHAKVIFKMD